MGIKQDRARALRVRQPRSDEDLKEDLTELAGSRASPRIPQRQRALSSFLTWQFIVAPIVAAGSFLFIGNGHAGTGDDQDGRAADHQKWQVDAASDHDQAPTGIAGDGRHDQTDASSRLIGAAPKALHPGDGLSHEDHVGPAVAHDIGATASPSADGEDRGGLDVERSDHANSASDSDVATAGLSGDASKNSAGSPEIQAPIVIGELTSGGLYVDVSVGESNLALATSDVVSTLTSSLADILAAVELGSSLDLKDYLGFDLDLNSSGEFIATDLSAVLDLNLSFAMPNMASTLVSSVVNPVSGVVNFVADGLPILNLETSNPLDRLLGGDTHSHSVAGHLGELTSLIDGDATSHGFPGHLADIGGGDPISALVGNLARDVVGSNSTTSLGMLPDAFAAASLGVKSKTDLPVVGATSDSAHVGIVVDATAMIQGRSIDLSARALPEGDVLFHGNSYTDYHVALQSSGPSPGCGILASTLASVSGNLDAPTHVDAPIANAAPSTSVAATVSHPDVLLSHISTTLDDRFHETHHM